MRCSAASRADSARAHHLGVLELRADGGNLHLLDVSQPLGDVRHVLVARRLHLGHAALPLRADVRDLLVAHLRLRLGRRELLREPALRRLATGELALEVLHHRGEAFLVRGRANRARRGRRRVRRRWRAGDKRRHER